MPVFWRESQVQIRFFTIPVSDGGGVAEAELNQFLRGRRVLDVRREFAADGSASLWCVCVTYLEGPEPGGAAASGQRSRVDWRTVLDEKTFAVFAKLRVCRKAVAQEEGVPAYAVFNDDQLVGMAKLEVLSIEAMKGVPGIGDGKVERYGKRFMDALSEAPAG